MLNKKIFRILSLVICLAMVVTVFAGCENPAVKLSEKLSPTENSDNETTTMAESEESSEPSSNSSDEIVIPTEFEEGTIVVLATGGSIAGVGEAGKEMSSKSGVISVDQLVSAIPLLKDVAPIATIQVCNINSNDITGEIWIKLANIINELSNNENIRGFVITHGTDTIDETAYFLNLTVKTDKPVILTGAMRPATSISPDGPMNLYQSICLANSESAVGRGVMVVFSDRILAARSVKKINTYNLNAVSAGETGVIGLMRDNEPHFYETTVKKHTVNTEFSVDEDTVLPEVNISYFYTDADPEILKFTADCSKGIVIAGAGAGEFSEKYIEVINALDIPVVISSRIGDGIITESALLCEGSIAGDNLPPQKAAILLRLCLLKGLDKENIKRAFLEY